MPTEYKPNYCLPPNVFIVSDLKTLRIGVHAASRITGLPVKTVNALIDGKVRIDEEIAAKLERLIGAPAYFWLTIQSNYDDWVMENEN